MLVIKPEHVVFENANDVVDYVALGMPPTKNNFNKVMEAIDRSDEKAYRSNVYVPDKILNVTDEQFKQVINQVYHDRCRNRNMVLGVGAVVTVGLLLGALFGGDSDKNEKKCECCEDSIMYKDDDTIVYRM